MLFQTIACNSKGIEITANIAERGEEFFCPSCKGVMILRRGKINIAHFAHKNLTPNCKPETVLHLMGKERVKEIAEEHLKRGVPLETHFACSHCGIHHEMNLLEEVATIELEKILDFARPDVSFVRSDGETSVVVEIVVTHKPEPEVIKLFMQKNVFYVRVNLKDYSDLLLIEEKVKNNGWDVKEGYSSNQFCTIKDNSELFCSKHGWAKDQRRLFITNYPCDKCHRLTKIAVLNLDSENPFNRELPDCFTKEEVEQARNEGVLLDQHKFSRNGDYYLVNKCRHCKSLPYSDNRLNTQYEYGYRYEENPDEAKIIETGYSCGECEWEK